MQHEARNENTYILDAESGQEMARLTVQHQLVTKYMGGLLQEGIVLPEKGTILDVACGPGGWVLDVAYEYPKSQVTGIDISQIAIQYAKARAKTQGLENNTSFRTMDATRPLDFPDASFDLVNARFLWGFMPSSRWQDFVKECLRITKPGGYCCLTECDDMGSTNSPAFEELSELGVKASLKAKRTYAPAGHSIKITPMLGLFMQQAGYTTANFKPRAHLIDFSAGAEAHQGMYENWMVGLQSLQAFLFKMEVTTSEHMQELYLAAQAQMMLPDFRGYWNFVSVIGQRPL